MALSGNIESFPLSEVLRLAARYRQTGLLRIESGGVHGKIYFTDGFLSYATTRDQDDLGGDLSQLGIIEPHKWYPVERGEEPILSALVDGKSEADVQRFLAERVADVLVRLLRSRHGRFDFAEQAEPTYITGQRLDTDDVLRGVEVRVQEWAEIEVVIPVEDATIHLARYLGGRDEVTIAGDTWRLIAALGSASIVDGVADATGLSDFMVARTMADLVKQGLLQVRMEDPTAPPESPVLTSVDEPTDPITMGRAAAPSLVEQAVAGDRDPMPAPEDGGIVEFFPRQGDRNESNGW
jgi:hypothetical protein